MNREEIKSLRVVVIAGGWSDEREISLASAQECRQALIDAGFSAVDLLDLADEKFIETLTRAHYDVGFVAMHGRYGEDGCVQGLLEILHIPYTFSGVAASAVATEKQLAKAVYAAADIRTPRGIDIEATTVLNDEQITSLIDDLGLPLFVKPSSNGSSFGISRVTDRAELPNALLKAGQSAEHILVEECIEGMEITVPVIGNEDAHALPIVEIVTGSDFYDINVKYEPSNLHHVIPARLEAGIYAKAQELAVRAHKALGCRGCSRSDFIVTAEGEPVILETNTIPGMTQNSLLPDSARHGGVEFTELCTRLVELALEPAKKKL